jgi:hypothetical protein
LCRCGGCSTVQDDNDRWQHHVTTTNTTIAMLTIIYQDCVRSKGVFYDGFGGGEWTKTSTEWVV